MQDRWAPYGAAAGALAILLFAAGGLVIGGQPGFDDSGAAVAAHLEEKQARIQVACALYAAMGPLLIWFLATVVSQTHGGPEGARRAAQIAMVLGVAFLTLFLADITTLAVGALRPENMAAAPELASALRDFEWLAMGVAAPLGAAMLAAFAVLALRDGLVWPRWLGWLAAIGAPVYGLRVGTLFSTDGVFAADGLLGLQAPVAAIGLWFLAASAVLALDLRRAGVADGQSPSI